MDSGRGFWDLVYEYPLGTFVFGVTLIWATEHVLVEFARSSRQPLATTMTDQSPMSPQGRSYSVDKVNESFCGNDENY